MGTNITENYFEYGNQKYFRGNAHLVEMGTYGEKKDSIGPKAYLEKGVRLRGRVEVGNACDRDVFWLVRSV